MHKEDKTLTPKICANCGKEYMPKDYRHQSPRYKFCSKTCLYKYHSKAKGFGVVKTRTCVICGKEFQTTNFQKKTCSKECSEKLAYKNRHHNVGHAIRTVVCLKCGKSFETNNANKKYCSDACRKAAFNKTEIAKKITYHLKCVICGKEFDYIGYDNASPKFMPKTCSKECSKALTKQHQHEYNVTKRRKNRVMKEFSVIGSKDSFDESYLFSETRICKECGKEFIAHNPRKVFCSRECAMKNGIARRHPKVSYHRTCLVCGKEFDTNQSKKIFCCYECKKTHEVLEYRKTHNVKTLTKVCPHCGKTFTTTNPIKLYCSKECKDAYLLVHRPACVKKELPKPRECEYCHKTFTPSRTHPNTKFCCSACTRKAKRNTKPLVERVCAWCGKKFMPDVHHPKASCCCTSHNRKWKYYGNKSEVQVAYEHAAIVKVKDGSSCIPFVNIERVCKHCGKTFTALKSGQKYCSDECRKAHNPRYWSTTTYERVCKICGKTFTTRNKKQITCSKECSYTNRSSYGYINGKIYAHVKATPIEKECPVCGNTFMGNSIKRFCSTLCSDTYHRFKHDLVHIHNLSGDELTLALADKIFKWRIGEHTHYVKGVVKKCVCNNPNCGKEFEYTYYESQGERKYCSKSCHATHMAAIKAERQAKYEQTKALAIAERERFRQISIEDKKRIKEERKAERIKLANELRESRRLAKIERLNAINATRKAERDKANEEKVKAKLANDLLRMQRKEEFLKSREQKRLEELEQRKLARIITRQCPVCGKTFTTENSIQKFCCKNCGQVSLTVRKVLGIKNNDMTYSEFQEVMKQYEVVQATRSEENKAKRRAEREAWLREHMAEITQRKLERAAALKEKKKEARLKRAAEEREHFNRIVLPTLLATGKNIEKYVCEYCGNEYYAVADTPGSRRVHHYCSKACKGYHSQILRQQKLAEHGKKEKVEVIKTVWRGTHQEFHKPVVEYKRTFDEFDDTRDSLTEDYISNINFN